MATSHVVLEHVKFTYPGADKPALNSIDLEVKKGEFVAIMGPTGSGKSTLLLLLNGSIPHYIEGTLEGDVIVAGLNTKEARIPNIAQHVGLIFDDPEVQLVCPIVEEEVAFGPANLGLPREEIQRRVESCLNTVRLKGLERRNPYTLSGGEKQSVAIAAVLAMQPEILVCDEPTSMLDPLGEKRVYSLIRDLNKKYGMTCILAGQESEEIAEFADRILILNHGEVVAEGSPSKVFEEEMYILEKTGIGAPQVSVLAARMKKRNLWKSAIPLALEEAKVELARILEGNMAKQAVGRVEGEIEEQEMIREQTEGKAIIRFDDVYFKYPEAYEYALENINLTIREGEFLALIGQNGSGKTTLSKHIIGILKPTQGKVFVDGCDTLRASTAELARTVGYCFQNPDHQLFSLSVKEELSFGPSNFSLQPNEIERGIYDALKIAGLSENILDLPPRALGKGERQRVAFASILTWNPKIFVIDEPTTGQDLKESLFIMDTLKEFNKRGKTVIFISHEMELVAQYASRVAVMCQGQIILDAPPKTVFTRTDILRESNIEPPQVTLLANNMGKWGVPPGILTVDEMEEFLEETLEGKKDARRV